MMLCPKCGEEIQQQEKCPLCGAVLMEENTETTAEAAEAAETVAPLEAAETAEEVSEEAEMETQDNSEEDKTEEETAEETVEESQEEAEEPQTPEKKKSVAGILAGVVIALLVVVIVCLGFALKTVSEGGSLPNLSEKYNQWKTEREDSKFDAAAVGISVTDADGAVVDELSNEQLAFYYWGEYYYFVNSNGFSFDSTMRLDEQVYKADTDSETGATTVTTWHQYFLESACYAINQTQALKAAAEAAGFAMPEAYQAEYDNILDSMATNAATAGFVDADGNGDALAFIQDSYGPDVTIEAFESYLYDSYYVSAYSDQIYYEMSYDDSQIEAYFDENAEMYASYGIEKLDIPNVNVRHILVEPEHGEDGTISEEAWTAAEEEAQRIYQEWQDGEATEESFAALAGTYSTDPGSSANGGLYESVCPGEMVPAFNDWCFDEARQSGDSGIVQTDYGYHIMYFVSHTEEYYWKSVAESDMRYYDGAARLEEIALQYTTSVTEDADVRYPDAVKMIMNSEMAVG